MVFEDSAGRVNMYTVYKVTNLVNNKIYIGVHKTNNPYDSYMGSGKFIMKAHRKYGLHNFKKEILYVYDTKNDYEDMVLAFKKEEELVTEDFIKLSTNYNAVIGGIGCRAHSNETLKKISETTSKSMTGRKCLDSTKSKISAALKGSKVPNHVRLKISKSLTGIKTGPMSEETKLKISKSLTGNKMTKEHIEKLSNSLTGRKLSDEHKLNISKASTGRKYPLSCPCPYCGKIVRKACYKRWHGDNCKMRKG
ncbi:putative Seg-like homing DNA endonuclease [Salmonella phage STP4-a]|uniref:Seg-like homing DNA endonuclease n=1 Tax=Salmonella phage STP4-a TaxID=1445860 RepID=A0A0B4L9B9_9CAUD|nr:NAD synthetase [Salmonella phage STP4-a]AHJ86989.1 putative Seg-like homing DNA endonuclease [Salmonella phage STP4-a]